MTAMSIMIVTVTATSITIVTMTASTTGISATITRKREIITSGTAGKNGLGIAIGKTNTIRIWIGIERTNASGIHTGTGDTTIPIPFFSASIFASAQKALKAA